MVFYIVLGMALLYMIAAAYTIADLALTNPHLNQFALLREYPLVFMGLGAWALFFLIGVLWAKDYEQ